MPLPASTAQALKEWAVVLDALAQGTQTILMRKGGLIEPAAGFKFPDEPFVFYPTYEHQTVRYLKPAFRASFEAAMARRAPAGMIRFELAGRVCAASQVRDEGVLDRLEGLHIYSGELLSQRLGWKPGQPVVAACVRVYRLADPVLLPAKEEYAGCRSWVSLEHPVALAAAAPVLDDASFEARLERFKDLAG